MLHRAETNPDQHPGALKPLMVVSGDDDYQVQQTLKTLMKTAKQLGYTTLQRFHVNHTNQWSLVWRAANHQSLLADKQLIIARATFKTITKTVQQTLLDYCQQPDNATMLVLVLPKLTQSQRKQAWLLALNATGALTEVRPITRAQWPDWLKARCRRYGMDIAPDASQWLCDHVEGCTARGAQEIEKLYCLYGLPAKAQQQPVTLTLAHCLNNVTEQAQFDIFDLTDSCLHADAHRALHIIDTLEHTGSELTLINWALARLLRQLMALHHLADASFGAVCQRQGIWKNQQALFKQALTRISAHACLDGLLACQHLDECIKGIGDDAPWRVCQRIVASLCGHPLLPHYTTAPHLGLADEH